MTTVPAGVKEFQALVDRMNETIERLQARAALESDLWFWRAMRNYYQQALEGKLKGRPLAAVGMFPPQELFHALDIPYYVAENHGIMTAQSSPEMGERLFDAAERYGMASDICSPHRAALGLAQMGMALKPDFVVSTSTTCDQTLKLYELLADFYRIPSFMLDTPYRADERGLEYASPAPSSSA